MELIEGSETLAIRTQTLGNYPTENILHIEHSESLKSRIQVTGLFMHRNTVECYVVKLKVPVSLGFVSVEVSL